MAIGIAVDAQNSGNSNPTVISHNVDRRQELSTGEARLVLAPHGRPLQKWRGQRGHGDNARKPLIYINNGVPGMCPRHIFSRGQAVKECAYRLHRFTFSPVAKSPQ
jgi:hypothetical protein